jgi:hypothetical protein
MLRLAAPLVLVALAASLAACGGTASSLTTASASPSPAASGSYNTTYIAIGEDSTVGIGTTACGTTLPSTVCPSNTVSVTGTRQIVGGAAVNGYSQLLATSLAALHPAATFSFVPLGVTGALSGSAPVPGPSPNSIVLNADQLATLPATVAAATGLGNRTIVTFFAGVNDVVDAFATQQCTGTLTGNNLSSPTATDYCDAHGTTLADSTGDARKGTLYSGYDAILSAVKVANPTLLIVIGVPNVSTFPAFSGLSSTQATQLSNDSTLADTALQDALTDVGYNPLYVHLLNNSILTSTSFAADGYHLNDTAGSAISKATYNLLLQSYPSF